MAQDTNQNRPADVAQADSVGGMAKRLLNPAHLSDLARRSAATLKEQGAEQLWRDVTFRVGLAFHHDSWQHRADLPLRRELKAQRAEYADGKPGPVVSVKRHQQHAGKAPQMLAARKSRPTPTGSWCWWMLRTQPMPRSAPMQQGRGKGSAHPV